MREFIAAIDAGLFWGLVIGVALGVASAWRFARIFERFREAVWQAKNHFRKAIEFYHFSQAHLGVLLSASLAGVVLTGVLGFLVYLRVTA